MAAAWFAPDVDPLFGRPVRRRPGAVRDLTVRLMPFVVFVCLSALAVRAHRCAANSGVEPRARDAQRGVDRDAGGARDRARLAGADARLDRARARGAARNRARSVLGRAAGGSAAARDPDSGAAQARALRTDAATRRLRRAAPGVGRDPDVHAARDWRGRLPDQRDDRRLHGEEHAPRRRRHRLSLREPRAAVPRGPHRHRGDRGGVPVAQGARHTGQKSQMRTLHDRTQLAVVPVAARVHRIDRAEPADRGVVPARPYGRGVARTSAALSMLASPFCRRERSR